MRDISDIFDEAAGLLHKGLSQEEVLLKFADRREELAPLLNLSARLLSVPKLAAPRPALQRKYALMPVRHFWLAWLHVSKFAAASTSVLLLVSAFAVTGYATVNSLPGQTLFSVKRSAENLRFVLASNQQEKASLQLALAQKRLDEARLVFNNPQSNPAAETAALNELASQTSTAVAAVGSIAQQDPKSSQNPPLLNSLESLASQQQSLITQIKPDSQVTTDASGALASLNQTANKISEIQQSVAIAGSDQTLASLSTSPNAVAILGEITKVGGGQITVEKTTFNLTSETQISDENGKSINQNQLPLAAKVNITGRQNPDGPLLAEKISLIADQETAAGTSTASSTLPQVKSASTVLGATATSASIKGGLPENSDQDSSGTPAVSAPYIIEDPSSQYVGN